MSRLRSSRASKASTSSASRSSTPARQRGVLVQAPKSDIYVALLGISLAAILIGCLLLILLLGRYEFKVKVAAADQRPTAVSLASHLVDVTPTPLSPSTA
ncbi:hypothetical protein [Paludisphaera borealis]|uniref:Uncharacterized protein n=1 Tax=Paludisphaera borealis TaxID=1387353 RepID=A0A1U7CWV4_9BACT|nr:hypothetical protein [Paludisphaera borealis]APW63427.1 hypothetical protein BSF38_04994 [Paludisphaera borealis]